MGPQITITKGTMQCWFSNTQQQDNDLNVTMIGLINSIVNLLGQQQETQDNVTQAMQG